MEENLVWVVRCKRGQFMSKWARGFDSMCLSFEDAQLFEKREGAEEFLWRFKEATEMMPFDRTWFIEGWALETEDA